jgi:hypothetical protein
VTQALSEPPKVKFYPREEITSCTDCRGHFGLLTGFWKFKFRLENLSGKDLIVYGHQFDQDEEFSFLQTIQYINPHVCEWHYPWGSTDERGGWEGRSSFYKTEKILKPGHYLEIESGISEDNVIPVRFLAYIGTKDSREPYRIFSEPYRMIKSNGGKPMLKVGEETCNAACDLSIDQAPAILGIKLGMSLSEFKTKFPETEIHSIANTKYDFKTAYLWNWNEDAYNTDVSFLDDRVVEIEFKLKSLEKTRTRTDFYRLVADKIKLPYYWEPYQERWECRDFLISVLPNKMPTITIRNKAFIKVRENMAEENLKRK